MCPRRVARGRSPLPHGTSEDSLTGCSRADWVYGNLSYDEWLPHMHKLANAKDAARGRLNGPDAYRGVVYRKSNRARRRFLRSAWIPSQAVIEPRSLELDDPSAAASDGESPPESPENPPEPPENSRRFGSRKLGENLAGDTIPFPGSDTDLAGKSGRPAGAMAKHLTQEVPAPLGAAMAMGG